MKKMPRGKIKVCSFRLDRMRLVSAASDIFPSIKLIDFEREDKGMFVNVVKVVESSWL